MILVIVQTINDEKRGDIVEFSVKSGSPEKQRSACIVVGVFEPRRLTAVAEPARRNQ